MEWVRIFDSESEMNIRLPWRKPVKVVLGTISVCVVLTRNGPLGVSDRCSHQGESLSRGSISVTDEIRCPLHGYCFDLRTGREQSERSSDLELFPIEIRPDGVYIGV
ncbi:MAG: Rieske 2Fe-2S domain-containing protein [Cyclobacteriaceae bacterium]|nr:Rieske 2Fe-2S domain-containing protein [Cyclobacteriaceae bacterium]